MDVMTPQQRRKAMQSNRGRTRPERALASQLWREGFRYLTADGYRSLHGKRFLGQPDLIFSRRRVVVFVDGCFWHGCRKCHNFEKDCDDFWQQKIQRNVERDRRVTRKLRRQGWRVIRVREHSIRKRNALISVAKRLAEDIRRHGK